MRLPVPDELAHILAETPALREAYLVGGCVRDWLLGLPGKDFDIEVFGVDYEALVAGLARWGNPDLVGRSFGVVKLAGANGATYDFTLPRRDSKVAPGHKGFAVSLAPAITPPAAAARRDFTINALMYDPRRGEVLDFFGGVADLRQRVLRHTSAAFSEDPLRVLRGMQLAGRFNLTAAPETIALCRTIKAACRELAVERVREEWFKWAERSTAPSAGLMFLAATEWVEHYPELLALIGTPQEPDWHPEGDVFVHTCHCCDALVTLPEWQAADPESRVVLMLAVLAHDFGKPQTTHRALKDGQWRIVSPAHDGPSAVLAATFLERINAPLAVRERVLPLVRQHMVHLQTHSDRSVRRLARNLAPETIANLLVVMTADASGCPPLPRGMPPNVVALRERAAALALQANAPKPILLGRHLIDLGLAPGRHFGKILQAAFEAQLDGVFNDLPGATRWAKEHAFGASPVEKAL